METVSFSVRVNGNYSEIVKPSRGIRQGDLLSLYLFLHCAEGGFSCMLKKYGAAHLSQGVRVGIHCPRISHLLFADDVWVLRGLWWMVLIDYKKCWKDTVLGWARW